MSSRKSGLKRLRSPSSNSSSIYPPKRQRITAANSNNSSCSVRDSSALVILLQRLQHIEVQQETNMRALHQNHTATKAILANLVNKHDKLQKNHNAFLRNYAQTERLTAINGELAMQKKTVVSQIRKYSKCLAWWGIKLGASRLVGGPIAELAKEVIKKMRS